MGTPLEPAPPASPADVAAWLRARTQDSEGREIGLFTEDTRPSVGQVDVALKQARTLVAGKMGSAPPDPCGALYETVVALQAACIIEKSYFPEQVVSGRSAYEQLAEELTAAMDALNTCIVNGGLGPDQGGGNMGVYDVCTPRAPCGDDLWAPDNWNNPYADDVDDTTEPTRAQAWLRGMQPVWAGYPIVYNPVTGRWELAIPTVTPYGRP